MSELLQFIKSYPVWVVGLSIGWVVYSAAVVIVLLVTDREQDRESIAGREQNGEQGHGQGLMMDVFRRVYKEDNTFILEMKLRNDTEDAVNLNHLRLEFYGKGKPKGGLQVSNSTEVPCVVVFDKDEGNEIWAKFKNGQLQYRVDVQFPFAGQSYGIVSIPLEPTLEAAATYRFLVRFDTDALPKGDHKHVEGTVLYNQNVYTNAIEEKIEKRS